MLRISRPPLTYQPAPVLTPAQVDLHREGADLLLLEGDDRPAMRQRVFIEETDAVRRNVFADHHRRQIVHPLAGLIQRGESQEQRQWNPTIPAALEVSRPLSR